MNEGDFPRWKDLPARALMVIERVLEALAAGEIQVSPQLQPLAERELRVLRNIFGNPDAPVDTSPSILPPAWLQERWKLVFPQSRCWYAHLPDGKTITFTTKAKEADYKGKLAEAFSEGLVKGHSFVEAVLDKPDPLMELAFVRQAREKILEKGQESLPALLNSSGGSGSLGLNLGGIAVALLAGGLTGGSTTAAYWAYSQHQQGSQKQEAVTKLAKELKLLVDFERLKLAMEVEFKPEGKGTAVRIQQVKGADVYSVHYAVHLQRLAVLLLWLWHGKDFKNVSQDSLDYAEVEESFQKLGWSEWCGHPAWSKSGVKAFKAVQAALEEHMAERGAEEFLDDGDTKVWKIREKGFLGIPRLSKTAVLLTKRLHRRNLVNVVHCLDEGKFDRLLVVVNAIDGPTAGRLTKLVSQSKSLALAVIQADLCGGDPGAVEALEHLFVEMDQASPKPAKDILLAIAPTMGLADPMLGPCWLGLHNMKYVKEKEKSI